MLLQAVLDIIVDQALDVVEAFRSRLTSLEAAVLVNPKLDSVRHRQCGFLPTLKC